MNRVIMTIEIIRYTFDSKFKVISIDLITRFHDVNMNIGILGYISNSKYKVISIDLIMRFHEPCDYEYWNYQIYLKIKI